MPNYSTELTGGKYVYNTGSQALTKPLYQPIHVKTENSKARFEYKSPEDSRQSDKAMEICALMALRK
jgi:hypothetical protein